MEITQFAPVLIPTLNRYEHFKRCVESLAHCTHADKTDLFIALDYPLKDTHWEGFKKIKQYLSEISGFKTITIIERERNFGAIDNFISSQKYLFELYERIIISEDDNVFSPNFLDYINKGLEIFKSSKEIYAICGYNYPILMPKRNYSNDYYFSKKFSAWGYGTWRNREVELFFTSDQLRNTVSDIKLMNKIIGIHGISILLNYLIYVNKDMNKYGDGAITLQLAKQDLFCVFPVISKVRNTGHDGSGVHCGIIQNNPYIMQSIDNEHLFSFSQKKISSDREIDKKLKDFNRLSLKEYFILIIELLKFIIRK